MIKNGKKKWRKKNWWIKKKGKNKNSEKALTLRNNLKMVLKKSNEKLAEKMIKNWQKIPRKIFYNKW